MTAYRALVTGAARRIGAGTVRELHGAGMDVGIHYAHSATDAEALAAELNNQRPNSCRLFQADLCEPASVAELAQAVTAWAPALHTLVNNASGFTATPLDSATEADFDRMLGSNLKGPWLLVRDLAPALVRGAGSIVNILDTHIDQPLRDFNAYGAAKGGMAALTRSLALELAPDVRVNGVSPGAILWPESDTAYDDEVREQTLERTPLRRLGTPEDIARTVRFLALDAPYITGEIIAVDGGRKLVF
jgi:pteridine reductase